MVQRSRHSYRSENSRTATEGGTASRGGWARELIDYIGFVTQKMAQWLLGGVLIAFGGLVGWGMATYNPHHTSWNTASTQDLAHPIDPLLALVGDGVIQTLGAWGWGFGLWLVVTGAWFFTRTNLWHIKRRCLTMMLGLTFLCAGGMSLPGLRSTLGGAVNAISTGVFQALSQGAMPPVWLGWVLSPLLLAMGALLYGYSLGFPWAFWKKTAYISASTSLQAARIVGVTAQKAAQMTQAATTTTLHSSLGAALKEQLQHRFRSKAAATPSQRRAPTWGGVQLAPQMAQGTPMAEEATKLTTLLEAGHDDLYDNEPADENMAAIESPPQAPTRATKVQDQETLTGLPDTSLITGGPSTVKSTVNREDLDRYAALLQSTLEDFGVKGQIDQINSGPVVTLYEFLPAPGIKSSRIIALADDIARSMSALSARVAVIPGKNAIGIELPNPKKETVYFRSLLESPAYTQGGAKLPLILGRDISGAPKVVDLSKMPHLLIAGTTGSGKSVAVNTMILSLLYQLTPDQCRFIMIDPKMLELSVYEGIPHLLTPVVTDPKKAVIALKWAVREMEERYQLMSKLGVRNILGYNEKIQEALTAGQVLTRRMQVGFDPESGLPLFEDLPLDLTPLPYLVVIVDEMADLMLVAGKDIEITIQRLAQMARAAGIHLIMATQRPSVDVITGTIKANFPTRISFQVSSKIDSRTILNEPGAEQLLGQGDMLYMASGGRIVRLHGPFVKDEDIGKVVSYLAARGVPTYIDDITKEEPSEDAAHDPSSGNDLDPLFDQVVALVIEEKKASTSFVQRHFQIGYNRAARLMDQLEEEGVVSAPNHAGRREILAR